jgi:hypothetical protein
VAAVLHEQLVGVLLLLVVESVADEVVRLELLELGVELDYLLKELEAPVALGSVWRG